MHVTRQVLRVGAASAALTLLGAGVSYAAITTSSPSYSSFDGADDSAVVASHAGHKHGGQGGHLRESNLNMRLVGEMRVNQDQGGRVADVAVHKGHAYLTAFYEPNCQKGGVYVFDIRNPAAPKQINFIRTANDSYAGEGSQALSIDTPAFKGDLLVHNNEVCAGSGGAKNQGRDQSVGGISLVDVSNPKTHKVLASGFGDLRPGATRTNTVHSAFAWQDAGKAYVVMVDNEESTDIDIVDITDPRKPRIIAEYDLDSGKKVVDGGELVDSGIRPVADTVKGDDESFLHDMVVEKIGTQQVMLASYWDGGYVTLDVTDPRNAVLLADSDFAPADEELLAKTGSSRVPEGNAHQAEFNGTRDRIFAADEDFSPYGFTASGTRVGAFEAKSGDGTVQLAEGTPLSAATTFVGRACTGDVDAVPPGDGTLALVERGKCSFTEKVGNVAAAGGWQGIVIFNREGPDACNATLGMSVEGPLPAFGVVAREVGYDILGIRSQYSDAACTSADPAAPYVLPAPIGTQGDTLTFESYFDGWGYLRLFDNDADGDGKLEQLDTFAVPQAHDPAYASGFGDLSVHEVAFSARNPNLAYVSYYSAGTRVYDVSGDAITEVGHVISPGGSNIWGVQVFEHAGKEYVAASDRDFGVQIYEYTGPGGPNTP